MHTVCDMMSANAVASAAVDNDAQLVIRLPQDLMDRLDAHADEMAKTIGISRVSRAEAARVLLAKALNMDIGSRPKKSRAKR